MPTFSKNHLSCHPLGGSCSTKFTDLNLYLAGKTIITRRNLRVFSANFSSTVLDERHGDKLTCCSKNPSASWSEKLVWLAPGKVLVLVGQLLFWTSKTCLKLYEASWCTTRSPSKVYQVNGTNQDIQKNHHQSSVRSGIGLFVCQRARAISKISRAISKISRAIS